MWLDGTNQMCRMVSLLDAGGEQDLPPTQTSLAEKLTGSKKRLAKNEIQKPEIHSVRVGFVGFVFRFRFKGTAQFSIFLH